MAKTKISEFNANPALNTDIDSINIAEGCAPSGINDAIRELMAQLKDFQTGAAGDSFNGPVGTTTAAAGAFTTLSTTGNVTFGGTQRINGTTSSALTITSSSGATNGFKLYNDSNTDSAYVMNFYNGPLIFGQSNTEAMRLTSTGLGIGTSSPANKLHVVGTSQFNVGAYATGYALTLAASSETSRTYQIGMVTGGNLAIYDSGASATRLTLDGSGNLGLGVTPSAWSGITAIEGARGSSLSFNTTSDQAFLTSGAYYNSGWKYTTGRIPAQYGVMNGSHQWYTAPSGTAGNAITFTQALTLSAAGVLSLGDTGTVASSFSGVKFNGASYNGFGLNDSSSTSGVGFIYFQTGGTTIGSITRVGATSAVAYNTSSDYRLKNITGQITNSGAYIDSLNPVEGTWKADGSTFVGLIAHEVQEASRTQVATGVKDGAEMQSMDYSSAELIANLIAEIQSLRVRVAQLESN